MTEQDLKSLYQSLEEYKDFDEDSANCEKFLATADAIVAQKNSRINTRIISILR